MDSILVVKADDCMILYPYTRSFGFTTIGHMWGKAAWYIEHVGEPNGLMGASAASWNTIARPTSL